jgi:hypothetical protein
MYAQYDIYIHIESSFSHVKTPFNRAASQQNLGLRLLPSRRSHRSILVRALESKSVEGPKHTVYDAYLLKAHPHTHNTSTMTPVSETRTYDF